MLDAVFLFSQFSPIEILVFDKKILSHWRYCLPQFKRKKMFYLRLLFVKFGGFENCQIGHVLA